MFPCLSSHDSHEEGGILIWEVPKKKKKMARAGGGDSLIILGLFF